MPEGNTPWLLRSVNGLNLLEGLTRAKSFPTGQHNPYQPRTFEHDVPLAEIEPMIRRLAEKTWTAARKELGIARTVVLKLKTSEFKILTRSHTPHAPPSL